MNTQIPENVAILISTKKQIIKDEKTQRDENERIKRQTFIDEGRKLLQLRIKEILWNLPEWIRPYETTEKEYEDDHLERIGEGYLKLETMNLAFKIPGLASIQFCSKDSSWRSAQAHGLQWDDNREPDISFGNNCYWRSDLEYVLVEAEDAQKSFVEYQKSYEDRQEQIVKKDAERFDHEAEAEQRADEQIKLEKTEAEQLFEIFKDDPIAIALMKAFLMVHQERSSFQERIYESDQAAYSLKEQLIRKAEDLRRQAQDAERQAENERSRISDLEDDLSKANKKLKSQSW